MLTLEELKQLIIDRYDADEFIETLDISIEQLVEAFDFLIEEKRRVFNHIEEELDRNWEEQE